MCSSEDRIKILEAQLKQSHQQEKELSRKLETAEQEAKRARVLRSKLNTVAQMLICERQLTDIKEVLNISTLDTGVSGNKKFLSNMY